MLKNWINIFLYHIKNNKLFTALNVLGLSIGIAGLIFAILYWNDEQSYDQWNPEKEQVYQVLNEISVGETWPNNTVPFGLTCKATIPEIETICFFSNWYNGGIVKYNGMKFIEEKIIKSDNAFFEMFPFPILKGAKTNILADKNSVAISEAKAQLIFGNTNPIGKSIHLDDTFYTVKAVYKIIEHSSIMPDYVFSNVWKERDRESWGNFNYGLLIKIKKGVAVDIVRKKMQNVIRVYKMQKQATEEGKTLEQYIKENGEIKILLDQLKTARLHGTPSSMGAAFPEGRGNLQMLYIMTGLSILILFLSVFNYINLATADAIKRAKEVGVRKILGATKGNIVMQFIFETILISAFSILLALVIVELSLAYYNNFLGKKLIIYGGQFYMQLGMLFVLTLLFAGIFPAVYVANFETLKVLKGNFGRSKSGVWLRNGMLILQFAIASFFIMSSYIVHEQVNFMMNKDLGFSGKQVIKVLFNYKNQNRRLEGYETTKQEIMKIKGVEQVSTFEGTFGGDTNSTSGFTHNGIFVQGHNVNMDYGFLEMMKIKVVLGRDFSPKLASDTINSMLMNETCVKILKLKNPINTIITSGWGDGIHDGNLKFKIVGVVKDFNITGLQNKIPPMVFTHIKTLKWENFGFVYIKVNTEDLKETLEQLESYWKKNVDNDYPFEYEFVDKGFAKTYTEQIKQKNLFSLLNVVVILIALFGLFALASFSIQRRMKEIAIRKTLGAETNVLLKELSKQYIVFCVIGFLIALFPVYYLLSKWLENFAYRIEITVLPFIVGFVVLLVLTLVVVLSRAYQATRVDVLKYLKYE